MDSSKIVSNYQRLKAERSNVEGLWDLVERFVMPYRSSNYHSKTDEGNIDWRKREIYDSTAPEAADALAASIQGSLITPSAKWFDLRFQKEEINKDQEAREWLEECADQIFMELQSSNFNLEAAESILDLVSYGTMGLIEEEDEDDNLVFSCAPVSDIYFEVGARGQVIRFYRKLEWTTVQLVDKFGEENIPSEILERDEPSKKYEVVWCIYEVPENKKADTSKTLAKDARPFGYKYVMVEGQEVLKDGGYYEMPAFVTRWRTTAGSSWGNSPAFKCMASIMDVNELAQLVLEEAALGIEPPLMTTQRGVMSDLDRSRAGITVVNTMQDIGLLPVGGDTNLALLDVQDLRNQIRRAFYEDQLQLKDSPAMTATEVNVRYELMQRLLGPTMGRLKSEFLDPLVTRTFAILYRQGKLPQAPEIVQTERAEMNIEYLGPLPRSQKLDSAQAIAGFLGQIGSLSQTFPEVLDIVDVDVAIKEMGDAAGVPTKCLKSDKEIKQIRQQRQQAMAQQAQVEQAKQAGEAMQAVGEGQQALPSDAIEDLQKSIGY